MEDVNTSPGETVDVVALRSDGTVYRRWKARVESVEPDRIVTCSRAGHMVEGPGGGWPWKQDARTIYWFDRPYNLSEVYERNGQLKQIYVHIASPAQLRDGTLTYTDLELDVVKRGNLPPVLRDEDEFRQAAERFGYSTDFQEACHRAATEAAELAAAWRPSRPLRRRPHRHPRRRLQDAKH